MSKVIERDLLRFICLEPLMKAYIRRQLIASVAICLALMWWMSILWNIFGFKKWSQIRRIVRWNSYFKAAVLISKAYATLLVINSRYISVVIIPITVLIFIGALFIVVDPEGGSLKSSVDDPNEAKKPDSAESKAGGNDDNDSMLFAIAVLPCWVLCCMGHFNVDNMVVSQFLLFLTSTLGELTLMMVRLPSQVAPALEVIRRASLVMVLVTAHTMAVELLGDDVLLACTPELITGLLWFSIHFGHGCKGPASIDMVTSPKASIFFHAATLACLAAALAASTGGPDGATDLLPRYRTVLVAGAFSVILPSLCVFALLQWPAETTLDSPSSELKGAIKLFTFCRYILLIAAAAYLVLMLLVNVRLRLEVQGLVDEIRNKLMDNILKWFFNAHWNPYLDSLKRP